MCGKSFRGYGPNLVAWRPPWRVREPRRHAAWGHRGEADRFFGLGPQDISSTARISAALAVLAPAALVAVLVLATVPQLFWLFFIFGWMVFPAFGLLVRGVVDLAEQRRSELGPGPAKSRERELLEALRRNGELTPARAAMETSLSVAEADGMLRELAEGGHLEVRIRGGGLYYGLWEEPETKGEAIAERAPRPAGRRV